MSSVVKLQVEVQVVYLQHLDQLSEMRTHPQAHDLPRPQRQ
jgi:hypothetical protein